MFRDVNCFKLSFVIVSLSLRNNNSPLVRRIRQRGHNVGEILATRAVDLLIRIVGELLDAREKTFAQVALNGWADNNVVVAVGGVVVTFPTIISAWANAFIKSLLQRLRLRVVTLLPLDPPILDLLPARFRHRPVQVEGFDCHRLIRPLI